MAETPSTGFCLRLAGAYATLTARLDKALGAHHGIGFADYRLLLELQRAEDGRLGREELARRLGLPVAGALRLLLPLEKIGLLTRAAGVAALTPAGAELVCNATVVVDNVSRYALGNYGRPQLEEASGLLERIAAGPR